MSKARSLSAFISDPAIDASEIGSNAVTTDKILNSAVTADKLHTSLDLSTKTVTFADNHISGNKIHGGVISDFASTGIDDNATATAVTIDSGLNVGINTTSLDLIGSTTTLTIGNSNGGGNGQISLQAGWGNTTRGRMFADTSGYFKIGNPTAYPVEFYTNNVARLHIDANGNVGIGTNSPGAMLSIQGNEIGGQTTTYLHLNSGNNTVNYPFLASVNDSNVANSTYGWLFRNSSDNGNLEIFRKAGSTTPNLVMTMQRSNGYIGVNTSAPSNPVTVYGHAVPFKAEGTGQGYTEGSYLGIAPDNYRGGGLYLYNRQNGGTPNEWFVGRLYTDASSFNVAYKSNPGGPAADTAEFANRKFTIYQNGNYYFTGSNVSDARIKQDIEDSQNQLENVLALRPKTFKIKAPVDENNIVIGEPSEVKHGLIAQEVLQILPNLVTGDDSDEKQMMGVDYLGLTSVLVKAIQEQQEIINDLKARLEAAGL